MTDFLIDSEPRRQQAIERIQALDISRPWRVEIKRWQKRRSLNQNSLYHMWVGTIAQETGNDHEAVHEALKSMFCPLTVIELGGEMRTVRSTALLNTELMWQYMEQVHAYAATDLGIRLPLPEPEVV